MRETKALHLIFNASASMTLMVGFSVSWIWTGKLSFGVISLGLVPWVFRGAVCYRESQLRRDLELSAVSFFRALLGLVQSGLGLSSALFCLAETQQTPFAEHLRKNLENYEGGRGLSVILERFRRKIELPQVGNYLAILEMAYCQGLEIVPLLEKMIPALELEQNTQRKISDLRRQMLTQSGIAFFIPWVLAGALWAFNPEVFQMLSKQSGVWGILVFALGIEMIGVGVLWHVTRFS